MVTPHFPGQLIPVLDNSFGEKKFFPISNLNLPWGNLRPLPLARSLVSWEKRLIPTSPIFREHDTNYSPIFSKIGKYLLLNIPYQKLRKPNLS